MLVGLDHGQIVPDKEIHSLLLAVTWSNLALFDLLASLPTETVAAVFSATQAARHGERESFKVPLDEMIRDYDAIVDGAESNLTPSKALAAKSALEDLRYRVYGSSTPGQ